MFINQIFEGLKNSCKVCGQTPCNCTHITEEKVRLDPKCWKGKKIGNPKTKMKGGVRVNNCVPESVTEGAGNIGQQIKALYQKIDDAGPDATEYMYYDSPIFAQYWDEYEGDLDSIIAEVDPRELQVILAELQSAAEDQGISEGAEFGSKYAEQLAQQVFDHNPNIEDENQVLNLGYNISKSDLGSRAQGIFRDEDFPSDFVSAYFYLQKQGVAEGRYPTDDWKQISEIESTTGKILGLVLQHLNGTYGFYDVRKSNIESGFSSPEEARQAFVELHNARRGVAEGEVSQLHKAWDKALKTKPVSPQQQQRNKERWAKRQAEREQGVAEGLDPDTKRLEQDVRDALENGDDDEDPLDNYPCYDCGSTIFLHHTKLCELAEPNAKHDLPSKPRSQHWTGEIPKGLHPIPGLEEGVSERMLPKSVFAGSDKHKLGSAAHAKGKQKAPVKKGQFVGGMEEAKKKGADGKSCWKGVAEGSEQNYLSQIPNLTWKPVSRSVWNTIQDEGLDDEQNAPNHTDWLMASLSISPKDAQALQAFDDDAIEDFNRFDIHLKSRYPGLVDLIDYDRGTVTIVKTAKEQGVAEGERKLGPAPGQATPTAAERKKSRDYQFTTAAKKARDAQDKKGVAEGAPTMWEVSFDYGPHMSKTVKVKAGSKQEAKAKVEKAAEKSYTRGIMINWVKPVGQGVAEADQLPGTPVVSLKDLDNKDTKKNKYGQTVPKKLEKDDPRVKFHKEPEQKGVAEGSLNEFALGDSGDDRTYEYEVYQCNPDDVFDWIGGPLYKTDRMDKAHSIAYELWKKHPDKAFMIWQERSQGSRGGYGIKDDEQGVAEGSTGVSVRKWANQVRKDHGADVKFWNRKEGGGAVDSVIARNSQGETVGVYNRKTGYPTVYEPKQGVAEMDKSQPSHGRDGRISHSTYGSRDRGGSTGPERTARATTAEKMMRDAHDAMMKSMSAADKVKKGWRNPNIDESNKDKEANYGKKYQDTVKRAGQAAKNIEQKFGPVDIKSLAQRLNDIERGKK